VDVALGVREQRTGDTREEARDQECLDLHARGGDAERLGRGLVLAHRAERQTAARVDQPADRQHGQQGDAVDGRQALVAQVDRRQLGRGQREAARTAHGIDVQDGDPDDLAGAERRDRQVVAPQAQCGKRHDQPGSRRQHAAEQQRQREVDRAREPLRQHPGERVQQRRAPVHREGRRAVRPDRHEARMTDRELTREAVHELQADRRDDRDPDAREDRQVVRVDQAR
jgi:hypothetical protein